MSPAAPSPVRWAIDLTLVLNAALGAEHFPIDVPMVAREISKQKFPDDPIAVVKGDTLPNFDGALIKAPAGKAGWGIFYNSAITSPGRVNFTLAHEFGHYLLHRLAHPNGFRCGEQDVVRWDSEYGQIEHQANEFAANFLMPLDDYRRQINASATVNLDMISACADRYRVSLIAAALRWLGYTEKRAVLVVSVDGYILWARSSGKALRTGAFFRTSGAPIEVPSLSLAARPNAAVDERVGERLPAGVWFREEVHEIVVRSEQYGFTVSLLLLDDHAPFWGADEAAVEDVFDRMTRR